MALKNLIKLNLMTPKKMLNCDESIIKEAIKSAGYFNQKAKYLNNLSHFILNLKGTPKREDILVINGIGNETADCIMLYAFNQPAFVVDSYTKRILLHLGLINEKVSYQEIKALFEKNLPREYPLFQEFHALLVEHAKRFYSKKPYSCPFLKIFFSR